MSGDAKFRIFSATLALCGCAGGAVDQPQRKPGPQAGAAAEDPYNVISPRGSAGAGGSFAKGGAASSPAAGAGMGSAGAGSAGEGSAGEGSAGAGGTSASVGLAGGPSHAAGNVASSGTGGNSEAMPECPSLTRVRLANGACADRVTEFSVATNPTSIATGSDGRIWFDDSSANQLVQLDEQGRVLKRIALEAGSSQRELVRGSGDVILWYSDSRAKTLSSLSKAAAQPAPYALGFAPAGLSLGAPGEFWLTEAGKAVHRVTPGASTSTRWPASPNNTIIVGPDENLWFPEGTRIARLAVAEGMQTFPITDSFADDICAGPDGALWFADGSLSQIGRMEVNGTLSRTYDLPVNSAPHRIIQGPDGALWFTEQGTEKIGRISVKGVITHYPLPSSSVGLQAITVGPDHNLWFTEFFSGKIGRLIPDGGE